MSVEEKLNEKMIALAETIDAKQITERDEKLIATKKAIQQINRKHGAGTISKGIPPVERIPTGLPSFDLLTRQFVDGNLVSYGLAKGQYTMIWGPSDVGKSCLMFQLMSKLQDEYPILFTDAEYKYDPIWAMANGVNADLINILKPDDMEQYLNILISLAGSIGVSIIDSAVSVASSGEQSDKKGVARDMHDDTIALQARKLSQFFRVATPSLSKGNVATIILNQIRTAGIGGYATYDSFPGGNALKHYCHQIIKASRSKTTEKEIPEYGLTPSHDVKLKVSKGINEDREVVTTLFKECGFDPLADLVRQLVTFDIITQPKRGWFHIENKEKGYRLNDLYPVVEDNFDTFYKTLMETQVPRENREKTEVIGEF